MRRPLAFLAAAFCLITPALAQQAPDVPLLTASGEGSVMVVPDIAIVSIGVVSRGTTAREALDANSTDLAKVIETIKGEGIAETDIGTSGFSVNPVYELSGLSEPADTLPRIIGYQVSNEVRVTIRAIASSGAILDKVVTAGANQINSITFDISDRVKPSDEALANAIAEARRKAEIMANAAGVRLVRIISVSANDAVPVFARAEMSMAAKSVPIMPGERQVSANATVSWEIAPQ